MNGKRATMRTLSALILAALPAVAAAQSEDLAVTNGVFCTGVENREPTGVSAAFAPASPITYHMTVRNLTGGPQTLTIVWIIAGQEFNSQTIEVGASGRWRAWLRGRAAGAAGNTIEVQVKDGQGNVLRTDRATIGDAAAAG